LDADSAPLHRLGSDHWAKAKRKAAEQIRDTAAELLDVYARRAAKPGYSFNNPIDAYEKFAADFPFEETPDQTSAIAAVIKDMIANTAMDRLICGDVGFGKTEVAMRATFIAVQNSKQVAILVPTTLLAQQHYESFKDRFADWPVNIEVLSRFKSPKEQQVIQAKIKEGAIDIVIGTHKLIQEGMAFKNLGLLVIDEEHRFGVHQKEKIKAFRTEVDILTLTATPIPRTLNMAMSGVRDLSIIATPPAKRLSIKTFVRQDDKNTKKEAILREILRGGQVYYLHNEVKSIETVAKALAELVPEARIGIGHGQLRERDLERVMSDFYHKRFNVLVCTTIIETGIDVPSANTIIIDRADNFGLAQLHQLRGRVGRSHHQAYAYLLTPPPKAMSNDAIKRLDAIQFADELGAGFTLATHDLEIRGAGELLGDNQSGHIHSIGFSLYMEMLEQAVESIKQGKTPNFDKPLRTNSEINFHMPAFIPDYYLSDVHTRLIMYKRISNAKTDDELKELQVEMIDRFGLLPPTTQLLFRITELKLAAEKVGIVKIDAANQSGRLEFSDDTPIDPLTLIKLVQSHPNMYKFEGVSRFKFMANMDTLDKRFEFVQQLLRVLASSIN
jgi:transcription-repair coupling factor (superfamily II helicase)